MTSGTTSAAPTGRTLPPALHYTLHSALLTAKNVSFVIFAVVLPVVLYLLFSQIFGDVDAGPGVDYVAVIMVNMAAYGSLGAAMSGGAQLAVERRSGWFRQLSITGLRPRSFLWARVVVIMLIVLPALLLVFAAGFAVGGVRAPLLTWLASLGLLWVGLLPMAVLGIVIGLWLKADAVQGLTTLVLLVLAALGGLWFPVELMPGLMRTVASVLPSYWLAELGHYPFTPGAAFPWAGIVVLLVWCAGLTVVGALGYRRAAATSKR
jgi:ABC-2 type transport system permease protein